MLVYYNSLDKHLQQTVGTLSNTYLSQNALNALCSTTKMYASVSLTEVMH